ncbi:galactomannan galactosyltransferase 1-like [Pyrus x bretschneideri]|uniref:galactomannan galactosyltransferase 1-like n=1 Tax=Pyrus x bretschneideri TaxID=225117 RepID=UPI002030209C|nr:galactomannan galactosyltransferase 1-like [Pyrus x bretschneideri]
MGSSKYAPPRRSVLHNASCLIACGFLFAAGAALAVSLGLALLPIINPDTNFDNFITWNKVTQGLDPGYDPAEPTFYDDPNVSYSIGQPMEDWDEKRKKWLLHHPSFAAGVGDRVLLVTGSQATACSSPVGDHFLLRFFKNKVDYCRLHGYDIFYNNLALHPKVTGAWAKLPTLRAAMLAHPEAEWMWWVDSDAIVTDMDFKIPLERYKDHNLVVYGLWHEIYDKHSWTSINSGVFLIRNCQWSMNLIEAWVIMGPQTPYYERWARKQYSLLKDKQISNSDDQSGLIYLLITQKERWANKTYVENDYYLHGYWLATVDDLDSTTKRYMEIDKEVDMLRRRHAEKVNQFYGTMREQHVKDKGYWKDYLRRPFTTHFTGCQPCNGQYSSAYTWEACWSGMQRALNFANNQVLRRFGYMHPDLLNSSFVSPVPFDFPIAE